MGGSQLHNPFHRVALSVDQRFYSPLCYFQHFLIDTNNEWLPPYRFVPTEPSHWRSKVKWEVHSVIQAVILGGGPRVSVIGISAFYGTHFISRYDNLWSFFKRSGGIRKVPSYLPTTTKPCWDSNNCHFETNFSSQPSNLKQSIFHFLFFRLSDSGKPQMPKNSSLKNFFRHFELNSHSHLLPTTTTSTSTTTARKHWTLLSSGNCFV